MTEQDELARLLQATARGDRSAFARLYELTAPKLLGAALHMLRRRELAEDVLLGRDRSCKSFLRAYRKGELQPAAASA